MELAIWIYFNLPSKKYYFFALKAKKNSLNIQLFNEYAVIQLNNRQEFFFEQLKFPFPNCNSFHAHVHEKVGAPTSLPIDWTPK
jgi:hypothetical protein